jgi:hypothetical protein
MIVNLRYTPDPQAEGIAAKVQPSSDASCIGLARTIYIYAVYIRYFWQGLCGIFGRGITKYTTVYGAFIRLWPACMLLFHNYLHHSCMLL